MPREKPDFRPSPQSLAEYITHLRTAKRLSLRDVEAATENRISNAYLSQLEHGRIGKPSPNTLYDLSKVYGVSYDTLMEKTGYVAPSNEKIKKTSSPFADKELSPEEEEELIKYLAFLRSRNRKQRKT